MASLFIQSLLKWLSAPGNYAAQLATAIRSAGDLWSGPETQVKLNGKLDSITAGANVTINFLDPNNPIINAQGTGFGDMAASMYDPTSVQADAFDRANHYGDVPAADVDGLATVATSGSYNDLTNKPSAGVTSVGMSVPTGLVVANSPITSTGTLAVTYDTGYQGFLTAQATKIGYLTVTGAINLDTVKTKTDYITVTGAVNLDTVKNDATISLKPVDIGISVQAYDVDTAKTDVAQQFTKPQRGSSTTLTSGTTITQDLADGNNWDLTLGHNATLANPTNQSSYVKLTGSIDCVQDGTGGRTLAFGSNWYPIGAASAPAAPTGANAKFRIDFKVVSSTRIDFRLASVGV